LVFVKVGSRDVLLDVGVNMILREKRIINLENFPVGHRLKISHKLLQVMVPIFQTGCIIFETAFPASDKARKLLEKTVSIGWTLVEHSALDELNNFLAT
jgi:hypothetical protein